MKKNAILLLCSILLMTVMCFAAGKEVKAETSKDGRFMYEMLSDGTIEITNYNEYEEEITIPSEIDGYKVSRIGNEAFWSDDDLKSVIISEGITSIGECAFEFCDRLESVVL